MKNAQSAAPASPASVVTAAEPVVQEPVDNRVPIMLDLPKAAGGAISHAGVMYLPHVEYRVEPEVARDLREIEARSWSHESSLHESENKGRRPALARI